MVYLHLWRRLLPFFALIAITGSALAQPSLKLKYKKSQVYSGIEVGSKGVKMSLVEVNRDQTTSEFNILKDTSSNTDFISFTPETFTATVNAFAGLYRTANKVYNIPSARIFTVVSSGVKIQAVKFDKNEWITRLIDSFRVAINEPARVVDVVNTEEEARLSHIGIIPAAKRYNTFLIDIGSGNTKGGYFPNGNLTDFKLFQLSWGTKSTANAAEKRIEGEKTISAFNKQLYRVLAGSANDEIVYAINLSGAYNMSDNIAFSGGIAWSVATLISPELIENPVIPVTYADVEKFYDRILKNYNSLSETEIVKKLADPAVNRELVQKQVKTVNKVFDQESLLAGTGLLLKVMRQFEGIYEKKQFFLVKNGQVGWVSAYVDQFLSADTTKAQTN
jgi:hypothetical protein